MLCVRLLEAGSCFLVYAKEKNNLHLHQNHPFPNTSNINLKIDFIAHNKFWKVSRQKKMLFRASSWSKTSSKPATNQSVIYIWFTYVWSLSENLDEIHKSVLNHFSLIIWTVANFLQNKLVQQLLLPLLLIPNIDATFPVHIHTNIR